MVRLACLAALAALALAATPASAQESGGVLLSAEFLATPGAQELARNRAFALLQMNQLMQQARQPGSASNPNAVNPSLERKSQNQQLVARSRGDAGFLGGFSQGQALAPSRIAPPPEIEFPQPLVINAFGSPVSIGDGNIVQQQVANSTAISTGAPAAATAAVKSSPDQGARGKANAATTVQTAKSAAVSLGGSASSTAANSNVVKQALPR